MGTRMDTVDTKRKAGWLPPQDDLEEWIAALKDRVGGRGEQVVLHPVLVEFAELIDSDPVLRMNVERMITEVPSGKPYSDRIIETREDLLGLMNEVLTMAPEFSEKSMVTTPLGAILDWSMGTPSGFAVYRDPRINAMLRKILNAWCEFLTSRDSLLVLTDAPGGWRSPEARRAIGIDEYEYDPDDDHWGFDSWNDFFTRHFKEGARPVASPDDDSVIVSACESTPYGISTDVQRRDRFWIKSQPYSLEDMLTHDEAVDEFVGGTVYQAYLSATNYHRWHSPVAGTIVRSFLTEGTYYSEADTEGPEATEPASSQSYLAHVATRATIIIEADNPAIGLVAFVAIGMSDVSSCLLGPDAEPGRHVKKGDELGYFQFGGSTHCLVFRPGVIAEFTLGALPQPHDPAAPLVLVRSKIAVATRAEAEESDEMPVVPSPS